MIDIDYPEFFADAACRGIADRCGGPERDRLFFPNQGQSVEHGKRICARCPVLEQCREYAINTPMIRDGIWGGLSNKQRMLIRRKRRLEVVA